MRGESPEQEREALGGGRSSTPRFGPGPVLIRFGRNERPDPCPEVLRCRLQVGKVSRVSLLDRCEGGALPQPRSAKSGRLPAGRNHGGFRLA